MADREDSPTHGRPESPDEVSFGNRPAASARVAEPASSFGGGAGAAAEATDFLGLSHEIGGVDTIAAPPGTHGGGAHAGQHGSDAFDATQEAAVESSTSWLLDPEAGSHGDPEDEEHAFTGGTAHDRAGRHGFSTWIKTAAAMLVGAGATLGFLTWSRSQPAGTHSTNPVISTTAATPRAKPFELADPTGSAPGGRQTLLSDGEWSEPEPPRIGAADPKIVPSFSTNPDESPPHPEPTDIERTPTTRPGEQRLAQWIEQNGLSTSSEPGAGGHGTTGTNLLGLGANHSSSGTPAAGPVDPLLPTPSEFASDPANPMGSAEPSGLRRNPNAEATPASSPIRGLRLATPTELAGIWPGDTIPMEAMDAESRLLTPEVGDVRTVMKTGEIFEGRLYAIGAGQVWLETGIGRLALSGRRVETISTVTVAERNGTTVEDLPRMRVRTPGGIFFGKVISRDEFRVTLLTDDGGRLTLESRDVEAAPLGNTRVIGPVENPPVVTP